mmetsp:Transcript_56125/g.174009  ORF Transcript_56125/g.174009 Transcript_56125/m.174009 type:complete len:195 (-) Transcript_56125:227-811(-)
MSGAVSGDPGLVNLAALSAEVQIPEAKAFYVVQLAMENIHSECYSLLIYLHLCAPSEKEAVFYASSTMPPVRQKVGWAVLFMNRENSLAESFVALGAVVGVFFIGYFWAIYLLKMRGLLPGLTFSSELIYRLKGSYEETAGLIHAVLQHKLLEDVAHGFIGIAAEVERRFIRGARWTCARLHRRVRGGRAAIHP